MLVVSGSLLLHVKMENPANSWKDAKVGWPITGYSIMANSWVDVQGRTIIFVLVYCPQWVIFCFSHYGYDQEQNPGDTVVNLVYYCRWGRKKKNPSGN